MTELEEQHGKDIRTLLKELYEQYGKQVRVAEALGIDQSTLSIWLIRLRLNEWTLLRDADDVQPVRAPDGAPVPMGE